MGDAQLVLDLLLAVLLAATLFQAVRLERALGVLKRDRAVLEELVAGFNDSTRQAEAGIERLRVATDGAGRQIARQIEQSERLRDDLRFLSDRGEKMAERLEERVRAARQVPDVAARPGFVAPAAPAEAGDEMPRLRSEAERELLRALRAAR